jgi:plasmid stabilization system protein ParE
MNYSLHPEAEDDLREAAQHYRDQAGSALALAFLAEFEHAVALLLEHPKLGAQWISSKRRLVMRRFPYSVVYLETPDQIQVLAVAHQSRKPGYWRKRT